MSFRAILAQITPASQHEEIRLQKGESFILIKEGQVEITLPNKKPILLNEGDSAHLTSFKGTLLKNVDENKPARLLIVASATSQHLDKQGELLNYFEITE